MTTITMPAVPLNRAYVQSKVIEANFEHLRVLLLDAHADIGDGLGPITRGFGQYVRLLGEACTRADTAGREEYAGDR